MVLGDVVVDRYIFGSTSRISREAPVPVVQHQRDEHRPGGAANAAVNVVALGARSTLLGVVGLDRTAAAFRACMRGSGVALSLVGEKGRATAEKTRIMAGAQGTRHQQVLRLDQDPAGPPSVASVRALLQRLKVAARAGARGVLLSDYGGGLMQPDVVAQVGAMAAQGMAVVVDSRWQLSLARGPVVLKPNAPELGEMLGRAVVSVQDTVAAAQRVLRRQGARAVVATRGREGMVVVEKGRPPLVLEAHGSTEVTDVTGAGDTVAAALVSALAAGAALADAARLANVAASVVVMKLGAATATPAEIEEGMNQEGAP